MPDLWVLIIDDGRGETFYDPLFDANAARREDAGLAGRLRRFGVIRTTPHGGRAGVLEAINDGFPLDLIVMDHVLSDGGHPPQEVRASVKLMKRIRTEYEARGLGVPPAVLWSAEYRPGLAYAFIQAGGRHAFAHTRALDDVVDSLWDVAKGDAQWSHGPPDPRFRLTETDVALLPYLEADWPNHRIAAELTLVERAEVSANMVGARRRNLVGRVNAFRKVVGVPEIVATNPTTSVTDFARDHGYVWVPLSLRDDLQ